MTSGSRAHTDHAYRYRPSSSKSHATDQSSPTSAAQMYAYNNYSFQRQQPPPVLQHMSRSSPPQSTWAVPQTHNSYYAGSRESMVPTRDEHAQFLPRSDINTTGAPAFNSTVLSNGMATSAEYFSNVIDTSTFAQKSLRFYTDMERSLGRESV